MKNKNGSDLNILNCIVDSIEEGVVVLDSDLKIKKVNKWMLSKFPNNEIILDSHCYKTIRNSEKPCSQCPVLKTIETAQSNREIISNPFNDNEDSTFEITTIPILSDNGEVELVIKKYKDINNLRRNEAQLLESVEKYKALYKNSPLSYQSLDINGFIIDVNPEWLKTLGYSRDEVIGKWFGDFLHPDLVPHFKKNFPIFKKEGVINNVQFLMLKKDNSEIYVSYEGRIGYNFDGTFKQTYCTFKDVSELKTAQEQLIDSKSKLEKILLVAPTGIGLVKDRIILDVNNKIVEMTGYKAEELVGQSSIMLYPSKDMFDYVGKVKYSQIAKYGTGTVETQWKKKNGEIKDIILSSTPLDVNDVSRGIIFTALDITRRKNYEIQLKENQEELINAKEKAEEANRLKTEFLNNMSHEIRTPMNGIIGFSEMLDEYGISDEKRKYFARIVQNSSKQLLKIIDDILEISTLETKQKKSNEAELCLNDLLMDLFSIFSFKSKERGIPIYIRKSLHDDQSYIISDKTKLNKILSNLLENAIKFTTEGFVEFGYYIESNNLIIYVKDTGIGISTENKEIIFERFSQENKDTSRDYGGLGLGLSISKENAQLLGGEIILESEKGRGSTFYVSIPYKPVQNKIIDSTDSSSNNNIAKKRDDFTILVAEDEEVNYMYIEALFESEAKFEYKIIHAKNGKEAVEICKENKNIDVILMDIKMPVMNGLDAAAKIKAELPNLPIIAQTAYSTEADKKLAFKHGCDGFISKPLSKEKLFGLINKYLKIILS